jgi:hypothetical protein
MNRNATGCNKQIMNKKENHSAKSEIEQAFLRLMTQKSYMDITVTDIVQEANVAEFLFTEILHRFRKYWTVLQTQQRRS